MKIDTYLAKAFARAILDPTITILTAQFRSDDIAQLERKQIPFVPISELKLFAVFKGTVLKGDTHVPDLFFIDRARSVGKDEWDAAHLAQINSDDRMRILCLSPIKRFQQPLQVRKGSGMEENLRGKDPNQMAPADLFREMKIEKHFHSGNVFTIHPAGAVRIIELPPPAVAGVNNLTPLQQEQQRRWQQALTTLPAEQSLPAEFASDLQAILRAANPPKHGTLDDARKAFAAFRTSPAGRGLAEAVKSPMGKSVVEALDAEIAVPTAEAKN